MGCGKRAKVRKAFRLHITNAEGIWDVDAENEVRRIHPTSYILHPFENTLKFPEKIKKLGLQLSQYQRFQSRPGNGPSP